MKAYVINLDERPDKLASALRQCALQAIEVERLPALAPVAARSALPDCPLEGGELGLSASFDQVLVKIDAEQSKSAWVLVFEDDIQFVRRFRLADLEGLLAGCPPETGLVKFGYLAGEWRREMPLLDNLHRLLRPRARWESLRTSRRAVRLSEPDRLTLGTHALAIRTRHTARIREAMSPYEKPLDHLVLRIARENPGLVLQTSRSLVKQRAFTSDIAPTREPVVD